MTDRLGHDRRYAIDPTKIKTELGWEPETMFETAIMKTIDWYLEHRDWVEHATSGEYQKYYEQMYEQQHMPMQSRQSGTDMGNTGGMA